MSFDTAPDPAENPPTAQPFSETSADPREDTAGTASEIDPFRYFSGTEMIMFERLTGYRAVMRRGLMRAADRNGARVFAADRLFTVLAEEAFHLADRQRRARDPIDGELTPQDVAAALVPMRGIAAQLGARGLAAFDRLEIAVASLSGLPSHPLAA